MGFIFLGNPSVKNGYMGKVGHAFFMLFVAVAYVLLWFVVNAIFGNTSPSLWDFIWQTMAFIGVISLFLA